MRKYEKICKELYFLIKTVCNCLKNNECLFFVTIVMQFTKHLTINKYVIFLVTLITLFTNFDSIVHRVFYLNIYIYIYIYIYIKESQKSCVLHRL